NSCLVPAVEADGHEVTTIEGLAVGGHLDPVQQAFADNFASQCGYCTPGMIMTAKALLEQNPHPSDAEIRDGIRGNLCRCTGYAKIVQAISVAAGATVTAEDRPDARATVGRSLRRIDADEKVTGKAPYAYDMALPGMVYGEILRSPLAHARITRIDTARAGELPGVLAVLTQADMPSAHFGAFTQDETALADGVVRYVGEGVAAVIAADEERFETSRQWHVCLEPHAVIADWHPSGRVTLWMSSQSTFFDRFGLSGIFGLPANKIRIICPYLGGGFGSKSEPHSIYIVAIQ